MSRILRCLLPRSGFRAFVIILGLIYIFIIFSFHSSLQSPARNDPTRRPSPRFHHGDSQKILDEIRIIDSKRNEIPAHKPADSSGLHSPGRVEADRRPGRVEADRRPGRVEADRRPGRVETDPPDAHIGDANVAFEGQKPLRQAWDHCEGPETEEFAFRSIGGNYVFSAYWDSRPNDFDNQENGTLIRVIGVAKRGSKPVIGCRFNVDGELVVVEVRYYEMCENHGRPWGGYILSCRVPTTIHKRPCSVMLLYKKTSWFSKDQQELMLTVRTLETTAQRHQFAVCIPPIFGTVSPLKLIEFVETSRVMGAQHFTFYDMQTTKGVRQILDYYANIGVATVVPWFLPDFMNRSVWYKGQMLAIQDCLYRNMHSVRYLSFNDIDEVIVPHAPGLRTWQDLVDRMDSSNRAAFQFSSAFFDETLIDDTVVDPRFTNFTMLKAYRRSETFSHVRAKCIVKPREIFEQGIHHVSKPIWAELEVYRESNTSVAFLHHYRKCVPNFGMKCGMFVDDNFLLSFSHQIYPAVKEIEALIGS